MAKFFGKIGFIETSETSKGVWEDLPVERDYYGDILRNYKRFDNTDHLNDDLSLNNTFSIVADAYANEKFFAIRYIRWMGSCWKVTGVEVQPPRLILTVGGVYNGTEIDAPQNTCECPGE